MQDVSYWSMLSLWREHWQTRQSSLYYSEGLYNSCLDEFIQCEYLIFYFPISSLPFRQFHKMHQEWNHYLVLLIVISLLMIPMLLNLSRRLLFYSSQSPSLFWWSFHSLGSFSTTSNDFDMLTLKIDYREDYSMLPRRHWLECQPRLSRQVREEKEEERRKICNWRRCRRRLCNMYRPLSQWRYRQNSTMQVSRRKWYLKRNEEKREKRVGIRVNTFEYFMSSQEFPKEREKGRRLDTQNIERWRRGRIRNFRLPSSTFHFIYIFLLLVSNTNLYSDRVCSQNHGTR